MYVLHDYNGVTIETGKRSSSRADNVSARATSHPGRVRQAAPAISEVKSQTVASVATTGTGKVGDTSPERRGEHLKEEFVI